MQGDFRIGSWLVQPQLNSISYASKTVKVEPRAMEVLVCLAEHTDEVLSKDRIVQAVWPDTFVTDNTLTHAISELRKAFDDNPQDPKVIETIPGRGYRLLADPQPVGSPKRPSWQSTAFPATAVVLVTGLAGLLVWELQPSAPIERTFESVAVLPLINNTGNDELDYLAEGIPDGVSSRLAKIRSLRVKPTTNLRRYLGQEELPANACEELEVETLVSGALQLVADDLVVSVALEDCLADNLVWGGQFVRTLGDILGLEVEVAEEIVQALEVVLSGSERRGLMIPYTNSGSAYEYYLRGEKHLGRYHDDVSVSIEFFEKAVIEDPEFALAYARLSQAHRFQGFYRTSRQHYERSRSAAERAVSIDPALPQAQFQMAQVKAYHDYDWTAAEDLAKRALEAEPNYGPANLFNIGLQLLMGHWNEAEASLKRLDEQGDPYSPLHQRMTALQCYYLRRYDQALERIHRAAQRDPGRNLAWLEQSCFAAKGMEEQEFQAFLSSVKAEEVDTYQEVFRELGMQGVIRQRIQIGDLPSKPYDAAGKYARAGEVDLAFECLETAYELPIPTLFLTDARFDRLRDDRRYLELARKLKLPEDAIARHLNRWDK